MLGETQPMLVLVSELRSLKLWRDLLIASFVPVLALALLLATADLQSGWIRVSFGATLALGAAVAIPCTFVVGVFIHILNMYFRSSSAVGYAIPAMVFGASIALAIDPSTARQILFVGASCIATALATAILFWRIHVYSRQSG